MSATLLVNTATHWLGFLGLAGLIGSLALDCLVLPASLPDVARADARLRRWRALCLIVLVITTTGELVIRAQTMAGGGIVLAIGATPTVLLKTKFGNLWIARFLMLALALLLTRAEARLARMMTLALALGVALTTSLTGHAGDWGDVSWSVALDWAHVVATATWTGGLISLTFAAFERAVAWPEGILRVTARRFSRLAGWCLLAVVVSGGYSAWMQVLQISSMWTTPYGRVLTLKLLVVLALASCGAVNRYVVLPLLFGGRAASTAPSRFRTYVGIEALLAVVVFGCTALLVDITPARHARHLQHESEMNPQIRHRAASMLE
jgi:putative copper resistance protein D